MISEGLFWLAFIVFNAFLHLINFIFHFEKSRFLPYLHQFIKTRKPQVASSTNHDVFRYSVEFSLIIIISRFIDISAISFLISTLYMIVLIFNLYQYSFRHIYQTEPNLFNDSKLLRNAIAIVWSESKYKVIASAVLLLVFSTGVYKLISSYLKLACSTPLNLVFFLFIGLWGSTLIWALFKNGLYTDYPNDIYRRYHLSLVEIIKNIERSLTNSKISKMRFGKRFSDARKDIKLALKENPPSIHFIFLESYGSYYYLDQSLKKRSNQVFDSFIESIGVNNWSSVSNFSRSPTTGGQSWLTYTSMLSGLKISNNTYFENYLNDPDFRKANNLLRLFKNYGYTNYNINPIHPIDGINVPYEELKDLYSIDKWILNDSLNYTGDVYGFGECPPDQFSMNFGIDLIKEEEKPYTFFYLTKNTHSPFIPPKMVENWKKLNHNNGQTHIHKGFLKHPTKQDYSKAIDYQFDNLKKFINDHGKGNDIFLLMGDHQPPVLSNPGEHGYNTPVHVISRDHGFLDSFKEYGFQNDLVNCENPVKHEAMYSIFLRAFIKNYGKENSSIPEYEPCGLQL